MSDQPSDLSHLRTRRDFAAELTLTRERAGLTVRDVASALDVPDSTIGGYFSGRHLPTAKQTELMRGILRLCGVSGEAEVQEWLQALGRVRRAPGRRAAAAPSPYRGLSSFQPEDAEWFYGRERLTRLLVERLTERRLLAVVGPSGSGKSSLLRAGLIPALAAGHWPVLLMTPGDRPEPPELTERRVVVVDQFEELFTANCDEAQRQAFIEALCTAPQSLVVIGLRADFYPQALRYPRLVPVLQNDQVIVGPMTEPELRSAIVEPAARARLDLEEGLVELLLHDLTPSAAGEQAHDAGALPLLSHALFTTWERGHRRRLTAADYRDSGGISGAVGATAEEAYEGLTSGQRRLARQIFVRLVHVADDTGDTRRRVPHDELLLTGEDADAVLGRFIERRLITADAGHVELTHETLLTAWPRLRGWIDTDRAGLRTHRQLTDAAETWRESGHDPNTLYRGVRLAGARDRAADPLHSGDFNVLERRFLDASIEHVAAETRAARRRTRRLQQLLAALTVLVVIAGLLAGYAFRQRASADQQRDLAISRQVATEAGKLRSTDLALAAQLSLAAYRISPTPEARAALLESYPAPAVTRVLGPPGVMQAVAVSHDRHTMAAAGADMTVRLWNLARPGHPAVLGRPLTGHTDTVFSVAFSPDGRILASGSGDRTVRLWDATRATALGAPLTGATSTVYSVTFSPDGRTLATANGDGTVRLWDVTDPRHPVVLGAPLTGPAGAVQGVAFSPDGRALAAGGLDRKVWTWNTTDLRHPVPLGPPLTGPAKAVYGVAFGPDGRRLAAAGADDSVWLWTLGGSSAPVRLTGPASFVNSVTFSPDGLSVAAGSSDGKAWIWDTATGKVTESLPHPGPVTAVVFLGDGHAVATSAADGVARLWDLPGPLITGPADNIFTVAFGTGNHVLLVTGADNTARLWNVADPRHPIPLGPTLTNTTRAARATGAAALSPDAHTLAVGDIEGGVQLWDVSDPQHPVPVPTRLTGPPKNVESITFSPDGHVLAISADDATVRLWDVTDPLRPVRRGPPLTGPSSYAYSPVFSPDGRTLAEGSADKTVRLWDLSDPSRAVSLGPPLRLHTSYVFAVAFSPDGRTLVTAGADDKVQLWDVTDRRRPAPLGPALTGPSNYVFSVALSADGRQLAAAAGDGTTWLWDITRPRSPRTLGTLTGPTGAVFADAFDTGRPLLATAGQDRTVRLWNTDPVQSAAFVCAVTGAPITRAEWQAYVPGRPYDPPCFTR
ncbi:MAG: transcriptional regulator, family [Actinomycetia bacterium]|nr:transcriptional regulator, family [Actinomycetes bacterium]